MAVYFVANYDVIDPDKYEQYKGQVMPLLQKHKAEILVADPETNSLEGKIAHVSIVIKFESKEAAMGWYNDPAYVPMKKLRLEATQNGSALLTKGFVPPV